MAVGVVVVERHDRPTTRRAASGAPQAEATHGDEKEELVLAQNRHGLAVDGAPARAIADSASTVVWETFGSDEGDVATLGARNLRTRRSVRLARDVAPQYGLGATPAVVVYATATLPPRLVALDRRSGRRRILATHLIAPFASRGARVAWAEEAGGRQRIVVRNLASGKQLLVAALPRCEQQRCYRIDAVTLADRGVAFTRGAIGSQPSLIVRRAFSARRPEVRAVAGDPQPDLAPSSAGAVYYALSQGWRRWDFGRTAPTSTPFPRTGEAQPIAYEGGRWFARKAGGCDDTVVQVRDGRTTVVASPSTVKALARRRGDSCAKLISLTWSSGRAVTAWAVSPRNPYGHTEPSGVVVFSRLP